MTDTVQLRSYELERGGGAAFVAWWTSWNPGLRAEYGFTVRFALLDEPGDRFVWAVSFPGTEKEFRAAEAQYAEDPRRVSALAIAPPLLAQHIAFVDAVV